MDIVDQYHDPTYVELHLLTRNRPVAREIIKQASFNETDVDSLPSSAFAWEEERRFPIHTREDAAASILYRTKVSGYVPDHVDEKLATAAKIYEFDRSLVEGEEVIKEAAPIKNYVFPEEKRLPLDTEAQVKIAEHVLCRDFERLPIEKRADAFVRLVDAAEKHEIGLEPIAYKFAGLTVCDRDQLIDWVEARAAACESGVCRDAFDKVASQLRRASETLLVRKDLVKLASTLHTLDKEAGLEKHYDRKLVDPLQTIFNTTEKLAEAICDVAGKKVACSKLMNLPEDVWIDVDVPELAKIAEVEEFQQVFNTLPVDIKIALKAYV